MNLFSDFNDLNEDFADRQDLIDAIKKSGRNYNFDKYTDEQLYRIWERVRLNPVKPFTIKKAPVIRQPKHELDLDFVLPHANEYCDNCGAKLTTTGDCPACDLGEEDLMESVLLDWVVMNSNQTQSAATTNNISTPVHKQGAPYIVTIYYDSSAHKLRAQADDGVHGLANVAFPNNLRNQAGQQYRVGQLIWNGKNYRAVGSITPINSVANTQNNIINENKENLKMNFISTFEELNKLYEDVQPVEEPQAEEELVEAAEDEEIEIVEDEAPVEEAPVEEPIVEEEPKQVICECSKCGALVIKEEAEVKAGEETDLVNVEDECEYCEEAEGYKIIGVVAPYEAVEVIEEGLFSKKPSYALIVKYKDGGKANDAKSDWYCFAMSSDQAKLKKEEAKLKADSNYVGVQMKVVDMKTAKNLVHKDEFAGADNLDESIEETEVEEALLKDVSINVQANGNNVPVLNNALGK